jgi:hypothetical protein
MNITFIAVLLALGLLAGMLLLLETGRRIGLQRRAKDAEGPVPAWAPLKVQSSA